MNHYTTVDKRAVDALRDQRGVIINWLVKIALVVAILGAILFDVASIAQNFFGLDSTADDMAIALSRNVATERRAMVCDVKAPPPPQGFCREASDLARQNGARLIGAEVVSDNGTMAVHITLRRRAQTLIVENVGPLKRYGVATAEGRSGV